MHEGGFKVLADREGLGAVMEYFVKSKLKSLLSEKRLDEFRYFQGRFEKVTGSAPKIRSFEEFLLDFHFDEKALGQKTGIGPLSCTALSGDVAMISLLL